MKNHENRPGTMKNQPLIQKTPRDEHGAPTDLLCCKWESAHGVVQLKVIIFRGLRGVTTDLHDTAWESDDFSSRTRSHNWPFRCLDLKKGNRKGLPTYVTTLGHVTSSTSTIQRVSTRTLSNSCYIIELTTKLVAQWPQELQVWWTKEKWLVQKKYELRYYLKDSGWRIRWLYLSLGLSLV